VLCLGPQGPGGAHLVLGVCPHVGEERVDVPHAGEAADSVGSMPLRAASDAAPDRAGPRIEKGLAFGHARGGDEALAQETDVVALLHRWSCPG
jgi:hypothetical protein